MAASAMESKRLGLSQKSMFVVPNHLTLQWANEFLRLYPSAKLLVATKKDFETANRKNSVQELLLVIMMPLLSGTASLSVSRYLLKDRNDSSESRLMKLRVRLQN